MKSEFPHRGFTLIELMLSVAVVAVLSAIAVVAYRHYIDRARSAEIITRYDAIRTSAAGRLPSTPVEDCGELIKTLDTVNLAYPNVTLAYTVRAVKGGPGFRPVLNVCAQVGAHGSEGVSLARQVHDTLAKNGVVDERPVVLESMANFALRLSDGERSYCGKQPPVRSLCVVQTSSQAGTPQTTVQNPTVQPPQPVVQTPPQTQQPVVQPPQQPGVQQPSVNPPVSQQVPPQAANTQKPQPPAGGQGAAGASILNPGGSVNIAALTAAIKPLPTLHLLSEAEKETVATVAATMAVDGFYANRVLAAIRAVTRPGDVAKIPDPKAASGSGATINFDLEMRKAVEMAQADALERICLARRGPTASCR